MTRKIYPEECKKSERRLLGKKTDSSTQNLLNRVKLLKTLEKNWKKENILPFDHFLLELEE